MEPSCCCQVDAVHARQAASTAAQELLQSRATPASSAAVSALCQQIAGFDRECCGSIASKEFAQALHSSKMGFSNAEALRIASGLADCNGLLTYRPVARMLHQTSQAGCGAAAAGKTGVKQPPGLSRMQNRLQLRDSQPCINRTLCVEAAEQAVSPAEYHRQHQQQHDQGLLQQKPEPQVQQHPGSLQKEVQRPIGDADAATCEGMPAAARNGRAPPLAAKAPYWFSKGMIGDMAKPYTWSPSKDNAPDGSLVTGAQYCRPWSARALQQTMPVQVHILCCNQC